MNAGQRLMGYPLYREVRDFAPAGWDPAELVVALMIADDANDVTRVSWIPLPLLCARTRLSHSGLRKALGRLAAGGYEFRVVHGYDKRGVPVFATKGHAVDYAVPDMLKGDPGRSPYPVDKPAEGDPSGTPYAPPKVTPAGSKVTRNDSKGDPSGSPLSSDLLSISSPTEVLDLTGAVEGARDPSPVDNADFDHSADAAAVADASRRPPGLTDEQWAEIAWLAPASDQLAARHTELADQDVIDKKQHRRTAR